MVSSKLDQMSAGLTLILFSAIAAGVCSCSSKVKVSGQPKGVSLTKEVLLREDGQDRHWVMKAGSLIKEEHYLTAHGDLHFVVEYAKGVLSPQVDSTGEQEKAEAVTKGFWRNGRLM